MNTELLVFTFDDPTGADSMLGDLKELQNEDLIELVDAVIVTKDLNSKVEVRQPLEVGPGKGAAFGALTGAVVGLIAGPAGAIVGLVSGAVTGGAAGKAMEAELPQNMIKALGDDELDPGDSALLVYVDEIWIDQVEQAAENFNAAVYHQMVADERKAEREQKAEVRKEKIDAAYKSWQARLDQQRASITALRQKSTSTLQTDRDNVQKQIKQANAKLDQTYQNMVHRLQVWQQQNDADIKALEVDIKHANATTKAGLEQRLAAAKQSRQTLRTKVKDTLTSRLNHVKSEADSLKARADHAQGQAKDKTNARIAKLQADIKAEQQRLDDWADADDVAWDEEERLIDEAMLGYWDTLGVAEDEFYSEYEYD